MDDTINGSDKWEAIVNLSEIKDLPTNWGYELVSSGKKILAKKFEIFGGEVHDFTIYRLESMIDASWLDDADAGEILEAYLEENVLVEWIEGFPMAYPNPDDPEYLDDLDDFV